MNILEKLMQKPIITLSSASHREKGTLPNGIIGRVDSKMTKSSVAKAKQHNIPFEPITKQEASLSI